MPRLTHTLVGLLGVGLTLTGAPALSSVTTLGAAPSGSRVAEAPDGLGAALDTVLADPRFDGAMVSLVVRDAETGEAVYERAADQRLNPASTAKLFTSAAAMDVLGPDHRFTTELLTDGPTTGGQLHSDLYLRGGGDPTALAEDYRALARGLAAAGVSTVRGDLVADDGYFDDVPYGAAWSWDDEPYYYSAVTSALTVAPDTDYDSGTVIVATTPSAVGDAPEVSLQPATGVLEVVNRATTGPAGSADTLTVEREHATDRVVVSGSVPAGGATIRDWVTVPDPTAYAADVLRRALAAEGVTVKGRVREGSAPEDAEVLASDSSMTLRELLVPFMKLSNNMHAEALVKAMGRERSGDGGWRAGTAIVREYAARQGVDVGSLRLSDGSGLSRFDLLSARDLTDLLVGVRDEPWFEAWYDALPVAGVPERLVGGTLRSRMRNTPAAGNLHAKTGSMTSVSALAGYVTDADGRPLVFAMVTNNHLLSPRALEDQVGATLAGWGAEAGLSASTPTAQRLRRTTDHGPADVECSWVKAC
jgi:D-alanyl-D-alanine carboxypeptidase/D-alanyl-D-alanine-endopeptidase (penicillin-binding protein 4)